MNEMLRLMASHASVRRFKPDPIDDRTLDEIITAARQAPTSSNLQAYSIIVIKDNSKKETIAKLCADQKWVKTCPVFLVICPDLYRLHWVCRWRGYEFIDEHIEMLLVAVVDAALVAQNILLAAESCGLGGVMIGAVRNNPRELCELLRLPPKTFPMVGICLGHPVSRPKIRQRLPASVVVHHEAYDQTDWAAKLAEYDKQVRESGLYASPQRRLPTPNGRQVADEDYSWTEHTARRLASRDPLDLRVHMREFLIERGFPLR